MNTQSVSNSVLPQTFVPDDAQGALASKHASLNVDLSMTQVVRDVKQAHQKQNNNVLAQISGVLKQVMDVAFPIHKLFNAVVEQGRQLMKESPQKGLSYIAMFAAAAVYLLPVLPLAVVGYGLYNSLSKLATAAKSPAQQPPNALPANPTATAVY